MSTGLVWFGLWGPSILHMHTYTVCVCMRVCVRVVSGEDMWYTSRKLRIYYAPSTVFYLHHCFLSLQHLYQAVIITYTLQIRKLKFRAVKAWPESQSWVSNPGLTDSRSQSTYKVNIQYAFNKSNSGQHFRSGHCAQNYWGSRCFPSNSC